MDSFFNEYNFIKEFLSNLNVKVSILDASNLAHPDGILPDIYKLIYSRESIERYFAHILSTYREQVLYKMTNQLFCSYYLFVIPGEKKSCCVIGPFLENIVTDDDIETLMTTNNLTGDFFNTFANFYSSLRKIDDINILQTLLNTMMSRLWGGMSQFEFKILDSQPDAPPLERSDISEETNASKTLNEMKLLQERYEVENEFLNAVSRGELHTAEMYAKKFRSIQAPENRVSDPVRNMKNYCIIYNTLFRKAAERGKVHPIHINQLSKQFAYKIEACKSVEEIMSLTDEMVRKYCFLVKNHSMSNFSQIVQRALTIINGDLSANLTLKALADELNINASYLSAQFKKEIGSTITDYVTDQRIKHAIFLLNSTDMQIASIANSCGIPDIQYFSKIFKKRIGHTPSEYRKMIR